MATSYVGAIEGFKSKIKSIQRASLFDVAIPNFRYANAGTEQATMLKFSVKSAVFPAATVGDLQVNYMGRVVHWYGDRAYGGTWATTCILDGNWKIFNALYAWNQGMGGANRIVSEDLNMHGNFKHDAFITAYSTDGQVAHRIMLKGLWPQELGDITMDWSTTDNAVDLSVTWVYDYIVSDTTAVTNTSLGSGSKTIPVLEGSSGVAHNGSQGLSSQAGSLSRF